MLKNRYKVSDGFIKFNVASEPYRFSVKLFRLLRWIIVLYAVVSLTMIFSHPVYFVSNPSEFIVLNPLYEYSYFGLIPYEVTSLEYLYPYYEAGYNMPSVFSDSLIYSLFIILFFIVFNHFKFNKDYPNQEV